MPEISTLSVISAAIVGFTCFSRLKYVLHDLSHIDAFTDDVFLFITYVRRGIENEKDHVLLFRWDVYPSFNEKDEGDGP